MRPIDLVAQVHLPFDYCRELWLGVVWNAGLSVGFAWRGSDGLGLSVATAGRALEQRTKQGDAEGFVRDGPICPLL